MQKSFTAYVPLSTQKAAKEGLHGRKLCLPEPTPGSREALRATWAEGPVSPCCGHWPHTLMPLEVPGYSDSDAQTPLEGRSSCRGDTSRGVRGLPAPSPAHHLQLSWARSPRFRPRHLSPEAAAPSAAQPAALPALWLPRPFPLVTRGVGNTPPAHPTHPSLAHRVS